MKQVSVVVSTYSIERSGYLKDCIESLERQTLMPREIILVLDPIKTLVNFYRDHTPSSVKIFVSRNFGLCSARNVGVRNASGNIIAFIDDDAIADNKWLENLIDNYDSPQVLGVGGLVKPYWEGGRPSWFPHELDWVVGCCYKGFPEGKSVIRNPMGCNMSYRKDVFSKVGLFRTDIGRSGSKLTAGEEAEFSLRILDKYPRSKIMYDPSAVVYHKVPRARVKLNYIAKRSYYEGFSKALINSSMKNSKNSLLREQKYLKNLTCIAVPSRLRHLNRPTIVIELALMFLSTTYVLFGYLVGKTTLERSGARSS